MAQKTSCNLQKKHPIAALMLAAACAAAPAWAIEAGGIRFDDKVTVGGSELVANGAGVRSKFVFDVYAITLYLPAKASRYDTIAATKGARRIAIQMMRDVAAKDFVDALKAGMQANLPEAEFAALKPQIQQFTDIIAAGGEVRKGTAVNIDFLPATGTRVLIGGQAQGKDIAGETFYNVLLAIWLGNKPVQGDLKNKLLGQ